jgi:hypothetical protein
MEAPLRISIETSAIENLVVAVLAAHRQELLLGMARIHSTLESIMSDTQDLRARFEAALTGLVEEVRQTRTAADSMLAAMRGLREQYNVVVEELRRRGLSEADLAPLAEMAAALDTAQAEMVAAASENIEGGGGGTPPPQNDGRVGAQRAQRATPAASRAAGHPDPLAPQPFSPEERARREEDMRLEREAGLRVAPQPAPAAAPQGEPQQAPAPAEADGGDAAQDQNPLDSGPRPAGGPAPGEQPAQDASSAASGLRQDQVAGSDSGVDNSAQPSGQPDGGQQQ